MKKIIFLASVLVSASACGNPAELASFVETKCAATEACGMNSKPATDTTTSTGKVSKDSGVAETRLAGFPASLCQGDYDRFAITHISPSLNETLAADAPVVFTATVQYYVTTAQPISLHAYTYDVSTVTVQPGCGTIVLSGTMPALNANRTVKVTTVPAGQSKLVYNAVMSGGAYTIATLNSISVPENTVIQSPTFEITANLSLDMNGNGYASGGLNPGDAYLNMWEDTGAGKYWQQRALAVETMTLDVPLRGTLACGDTYVRFGYNVYGKDSSVLKGEAGVSLPAIPPEVTIDNFLTGYPVNQGKSATVRVKIEDCVGGRDLDLSSSSDFFEVWPTHLSGGTTHNVYITYWGDRIPAGGVATGFLNIAPTDGSFAPVKVDVSARGMKYDLSQWTPLYIQDQDDYAKAINLPFDFPYSGGSKTTNVVYASTNGTLSLDGGYFEEWWNSIGNYEADAGYYGSNFIAVLWCDNDTYVYDEYWYAWDQNDVYYRVVNNGAGPHMEILWWDMHPLDQYLVHHVIKASLYPSGKYTVTYDELDSIGMETVGYVNDDAGTIEDWGLAHDLREGVEYEHQIP